MSRIVHIIGAGLAGLSAALKLSARGERRDRARGDRVCRRPLPLLSRRLGRHDHRQRQSSVAVGQSCRARLSARGRRRGPPDRPAGGRVSVCRLGKCAALDVAIQRRPRAVVDFRSGAARARHARARLSGAGAVAVAAGRQDRRRDRFDQRAALLAPRRAAIARRAQYRSAARLGEARRRGDPRNACRRRRAPAGRWWRATA